MAGGLSDRIREYQREKEEERKREEMQRALENAKWQGPQPAPDPLPNPWQGPVFSQPKITLPQQQGPTFDPYNRPSVDTSTPMLGSSTPYPSTVGVQEDEEDTPRYQFPSIATSQVAPRPLLPSLSDRVRDPYNAPNRPLVPTQAQGPAASQWQSPSGWVRPSQEYQLQPDEQAPQVDRRQQILDTQGEWGRAINQGIQNVGQGIQQGAQAVSDWYTNTSAYQMAQARTADRRAHDPNFIQDVAFGMQMGGGAQNPMGAVTGAILGAGMGAANQTQIGREAVIRGQDFMDRTFEVPGVIAANEPWIAGYSPSELITPTMQGATKAMQNIGQHFDPTSMAQTNANLFNWLAVYTGQQMAKTQDLRKQVAAQVEQGQPQANLALRNLLSGYDAANATLDLLVNRDSRARQLEQQAVQVQMSDPVRAGELFLQAQELRQMTNAQAVESNMNPLAEFAYGMVFDPTNFVGPMLGILKLDPLSVGTRAAKKGLKISKAQALSNLAGVGQRGQQLTQAIAEGSKAAQKTYNQIIAPFQGTGERVMDATGIFARTAESKAALDTEYLWQGLGAILSGITDKGDIQTVLNALAQDPGQLVRGLGGLTQEALGRLAGPNGLVQWGHQLVGNNDLTRRLPILSTVRDEIANLASLKGEGLANMPEVLAELNGYVVDAAYRANGARTPKRLPFGASSVSVVRLGTDSAVVAYLDNAGKVIQRGVETTITEATRRVNEINRAMQNAGKKTLLDWAAVPANVQRAIMSDIWLGMRPANWLGNAAGATTMLFANDAYTLLPNSQIQDYLGNKLGGAMPNQRLQQIIDPNIQLTRDVKKEVGSGAIANIARGVDSIASRISGNTKNIVSEGAQAVNTLMGVLYDIPYGATEIKLPGGLAIPFGEGAFYSRAYYVPFKRTFDGSIAESINRNLVPVLQQIEGMNPQLIQQVGNWVQSLAENGSRSDVATGIRKLVGKPDIKMTLKDLGVPPELLTPQAARQIEQWISDAAPSQAGQVMQEISRILAGERNPAASVLNISPSQPGITNWTDVDMAQEAAWMADSMARDAAKAGQDFAQATQEATQIATRYLQDQQTAFNRVLQDAAATANNPDTWSVMMDFWHEVSRIKANARQIVDGLGQRATQLGTPEAWAEKWQGTKNIYGNMPTRLNELADETRLSLQQVLQGSEYVPKFDWWETIENYMRWDEEAFRLSRTIELGSPDAADMLQWQEVISRNREYVDNSVYELFGAFQRYPSLENFDIVRNGLTKLETMGAQVRYNLDQLLDRLAAGDISKAAYARARNLAWNNYFDAGVYHNEQLGKAIIRNGVLQEAGVTLKWTENGTEYQLARPSETPNKFWARNTQTGAEEEFTVAQTGDELSPFTIPKNIVDDYNRLMGNETAVDQATETIAQEIADSAPPIIRTQDYAYDTRNTRGYGPSPSDTPPVQPANTPPVVENISARMAYDPDAVASAGPEVMSRAEYDYLRDKRDDAEYYSEYGAGGAFGERYSGGWQDEELRGQARIAFEDAGYDDLPEGWQVGDPYPGSPDWYEDPRHMTIDVESSVRPERQALSAPEGWEKSAEISHRQTGENLLPPTPTTTIPTNDDIRRIASESGIATATKAGRPTDKHLVNSLNKRMGTSIKKLDDLTDIERMGAVDALKARGEEQVSRMSPAEAQAAVKESTVAPAPESIPFGEWQPRTRGYGPPTKDTYTPDYTPPVYRQIDEVVDQGAEVDFRPEITMPTHAPGNTISTEAERQAMRNAAREGVISKQDFMRGAKVQKVQVDGVPHYRVTIEMPDGSRYTNTTPVSSGRNTPLLAKDGAYYNYLYSDPTTSKSFTTPTPAFDLPEGYTLKQGERFDAIKGQWAVFDSKDNLVGNYRKTQEEAVEEYNKLRQAGDEAAADSDRYFNAIEQLRTGDITDQALKVISGGHTYITRQRAIDALTSLGLRRKDAEGIIRRAGIYGETGGGAQLYSPDDIVRRGLRQLQGESNAPTFGQGTRTSRPSTENMFAESGEDLPLVSGAAQRVEDKGAFAPKTEARSESMFDLRPQMGSGAPSYKPRVTAQDTGLPQRYDSKRVQTRKQPDGQYKMYWTGTNNEIFPGELFRSPNEARQYLQAQIIKANPPVTTVGDMAKGDIASLQETRAAMRKEWDRNVQGHWAQTGKDRSIPSLDALVMRYSKGGSVNLNLDKGELRIFEDIYGTTVAGTPINNLQDLERFLQQYVDLNKQIETGKATVAKAKQFSKMSVPEIVEATRDELRAAGLTDGEIKELATQPRRTILDTIESIRGDTPSEPGMVAYDYQVPSVAQLLGLETPEEVAGNTIRDWIFRSRRTGNNAAPQVAEVAEETIRSINDLERTLRRRLPEILQGKPNELTGAQQLRVIDAVLDWLPNFDNALVKAQRVGDRMAGWMMLNYQDRRNFDTIMGLLTPYHYFWSRMPSRVLMAALQKPALVNLYYEMQRSVALENEQSGVPQRLEGTIPVPFGRYNRLNVMAPLRYAIPAMSYLQPNAFVEEDVTDNNAEQWINQYEKWGPGLNLYIQFLSDIADGKIDKYYGDVLNSMIPVFGAPVSSLYQRFTGKMPAKEGVMARFGFGPDTAGDGFGIDAYRARRAVTWIAQQEGIDPDLAGYANQVIVNQYNGNPVEANIPERYLDDAMALAERAVRQAAEDRIAGRVSAYTTMMSVQPFTQEEQEISRAQARHRVSGYNPLSNPLGSNDLQNAQLDADNAAVIGWTKSGPTPGLDAQISMLYDEANVTGEWDRIMPQIEALEAQKREITGEAPPRPAIPPTSGSTADVLRGSYGDTTGGRTPQEQLEKEQKELASGHWDKYRALEDNADKAEYLRENPDFQEIYKQNIIDKGEEPEDWWSDYAKPKKKGGGGAAALGSSGDGGLAPGSVTRDDFTDEELDQYYEEYFAFNESKDWDGQKAWLLDHPDFARLEADRKYNKDGEYPWWYDDILGGEGQAATGVPRPPSQPTSVADVLRQPYDEPGTGDNRGAAALARGRKKGKGGRDSDYDGGPSSSAWSDEWDTYRKLGEDWAAKRQFMLDNPEFAKYYKERYGSAWWEEYEVRAANTYTPRSYGGGYRGGGGGGGGGYVPFARTPQVNPQFMDRSLWQSPGQQRQWIPYSNPQPEWLRVGQQIAPEPIRRWQRWD